MNPLQKLNRLLQSNRSNWNIEVRRLIKEIEGYKLEIDYQHIDKVEHWLDKKYKDVYYVHVNDIPVGPPLQSAEDASTVANWLHMNKDKFSLVIKNASKHTND